MTSRLVTLDEGLSSVYSTEDLNSNDENSALLHIIQIHQDDITLNVQLQLLAFIAWHEAFHQLRTVEQLGYVYLVTHRYDLGVHGLQFTVLSAVKGPRYIDTRVQSFLESFESKLLKMSEVDFKVATLRKLAKQELIAFFNEHIRIGAQEGA
ncbi:insulin-degrading enzyme-like 1, peroxisomal isoform X2 [Eucalyptus grandis]|uniref:insulin-degrading enzyme-like 1, peroxisomal isoform X2 n=1 Tax=Eucalyptus grandis TaxID=71139 RepID=UPI00192EFF87|nr:insulin-degrading enzyme-like 1, peroxisomal isoform X2 [Eucalyptus grandis]